MCILLKIFQRFAANKELTVAHKIIQGAPLIRGHNWEFRFICIKYNIAANKELTVAHEIIQAAPLIRGHNQQFRFICIKYNIEF